MSDVFIELKINMFSINVPYLLQTFILFTQQQKIGHDGILQIIKVAFLLILALEGGSNPGGSIF